MKKLIQIFSVLVLVVAFTAAQAQKAKITFNELEHDFGAFEESAGVQTTTFIFTNEGAQPLILNAVRASCGCTTPEWTREPVAPGGTGQIKVSYNPANRPGTFAKTVTVQSNAETPTTILRIKGNVEEKEKTLAELYPMQIGDLRVKTNHVSFARIKENEAKTQEMEIINDSDAPVQVGFRTIPNHVTASIEPETIPANGKATLKVTYDAEKANTYGFTSHRIYLTLNGSNDYQYSVGVSATIDEDFSSLSAEEMEKAPVASFSETSFDFGDMTQGDKVEHTFVLANTGQSQLVIRNIRPTCGCTVATPETKVIAPGETAPIKVTFDSRGKRGRQSTSITVITSDPNTPTTSLRISGNVVTES